MSPDHDALGALGSRNDLDGSPVVEGLTLEGRVRDFDAYPMVGVRVEAVASGGGDLDLLPTLTDGEGRFRLEGLAEGRYDLRFSLGKVAARTLAVPAGTSDLVVKLARPQGLLLVAKTPPGDDPPPVLHVALERRKKSGERVREYIGRHLQMRLLLWSIRPGTYRVTVWGGAYLPVVLDGVEVLDGRPAPEVQVLLGAKGGAIRGRITIQGHADAGEVLVGWRRLDAEGPWPRTGATTRVGPEGLFHIQGLPRGRYRLSAGLPDGPVRELEIDIEADGVQPIEIHLG